MSGKSKGSKSERGENIDEMKQVLLERLDELKSLGSYTTSSKGGRGDVSDQAAGALDDDTALQLAASGSSEVAEIVEALEKIDEGTYGLCEVCSGEIPWVRLEAVPYATLCVQCKRQQELRGSANDGSGWGAVEELDDVEESD